MNTRTNPFLVFDSNGRFYCQRIRRSRAGQLCPELQPLLAFALNFLSTAPNEWSPPDDSIHAYGSINGTTLHRDGQFQVEMFTVNPDTILTPHGHPDIDSIEVFVSGDISFNLEGRCVLGSIPESHKRGQMIRVRPNQEHGASIGARGGCFMSIQHWLNDVLPSSVGLNWSGPPHEEAQKRKYL